MDSFLTLSDTGDELSVFRQVLETAQQKAEAESYNERRAQEIANGDMEDCSLEGKSPLFAIIDAQEVPPLVVGHCGPLTITSVLCKKHAKSRHCQNLCQSFMICFLTMQRR